MKKAVLVIAVALMAVAMLALPISVVSADKPEKFVSMTIYGYPAAVVDPTAETHHDSYIVGESDNGFMIWWDTDWRFCESYTPKTAPPKFTPVNTFAAGHYNGKWVFHGLVVGPPQTFTGLTVHGTYSMEITTWEGEPATGNLVLVENGNDKMNIVSGTINGQTVHGGGISSTVLAMRLYKYELTIHFGP